MKRKKIVESGPLRLTESDAGPGLFNIQIISPGQGSSGIYPESTLQEAVRDRVFAKGTQIYIDHPSVSEENDRPERSIRDLAGSLTEDAVWSDGAIQGVARIYSMYAPLVAEAKDDLGMSIRSFATVAEDGKTVSKLTEALSVDLVTKAGRGGAVLSAIESARRDRESFEATSGTVTDLLQRSLGEYNWVIDFDPDETLVYYSSEGGIYARGYTLAEDESSVELSGEPYEVRRVVSYPPVNGTGSNPQEEGSMPDITDAELAELRASAARADELQARLDTADVTETARRRASESLAGGDDPLPVYARSRVLEDALRSIPRREDGSLDEARFDESVSEAVGAMRSFLEEARGVAAAKPGEKDLKVDDVKTESASTARTHTPWGREIKKG